MSNGTFTHIFHPNNERMFENATIDIIVFRYCKNNSIEKRVLYNNESLYITNSNGLITFSETKTNNIVMFQDYFDIYVGLVSGKEDVYKNEEYGNIEVLNGENKLDKYIYIENYPCENNEINNYLLKHKKELIERGIRKFNDTNWFEWGAPRNISSIKSNIGKDCIYIYNLTRKENISFLGKVNYFGGGLIMLKPKKVCNLERIISYLNSDTFKTNFMFSGRFKIGHRQISNSYIPIEYL
jgi:adenine-specific DNA-methyltransferase